MNTALVNPVQSRTENPPASASASNAFISDQAFVTLLTSDSYLAPVLVLNHSLKQAQARRNLLVLVTPNLARSTLDCLALSGINTRLINPIGNPASRESIKNLWRTLKGSIGKIQLYATVYTKLRIWELAEFKKLVFLDSDMMVLANIDALFDRPNWSAVNTGGELPQYHDWIGLNSGLLVIEPSSTVFNDMMDKIAKLKSGDWGDQGFLHAYFPRWPELNELHLPHIYNMPVEFIDQYVAQLGYELAPDGGAHSKTVKIIHYWREHRPWQIPLRNLNYSMFADKPVYFKAFCLWMRAYSEVCETFPSLRRPLA